MYSKTPTGKNTKGTPSLESYQGRLRIRFRANGQQKTFSLGLADTDENRVKGESIARQMQLDMLSGNFDSTLGKYKPYTHLTVVEAVKPKESVDLAQLWEKYIAQKEVSPSTYYKDFMRVKNQINKFPTKSLENAIEIRDYLLSNSSLNTAKRVITNISACCDWAVDSKLIKGNPFKGMSQKIKLPKADKKEDLDINPFTREERDVIIQAFESSHYYSYYAPYVKFLFYTGCRPSEAIALQWKHITDKFIIFEQAVVTNGKNLVVKEELKTQAKRKFPINLQLKQMLDSIRPEVIKPDEYIFRSNEGSFIDTGNFLNRAWRGYQNRHGSIVEGIVTQLVREGKVSEYRKPYQTRHTFITLCLEADIDAKDVAKWVRNSPEIIYKHYAGNKRDLQVPEL